MKAQKFINLVGPPSNLEPPKQNQVAVVNIPNNFTLSGPEKSVFSKGLNFAPIAKRTGEFSVKLDLEKFLRCGHLNPLRPKNDASQSSHCNIRVYQLVRS